MIAREGDKGERTDPAKSFQRRGPLCAGMRPRDQSLQRFRGHSCIYVRDLLAILLPL
jgi:hypothetical protein